MADILYTYLEVAVGLGVFFGIALLFCLYFIWKDRHPVTGPQSARARSNR